MLSLFEIFIYKPNIDLGWKLETRLQYKKVLMNYSRTPLVFG